MNLNKGFVIKRYILFLFLLSFAESRDFINRMPSNLLLTQDENANAILFKGNQYWTFNNINGIASGYNFNISGNYSLNLTAKKPTTTAPPPFDSRADFYFGNVNINQSKVTMNGFSSYIFSGNTILNNASLTLNVANGNTISLNNDKSSLTLNNSTLSTNANEFSLASQGTILESNNSVIDFKNTILINKGSVVINGGNAEIKGFINMGIKSNMPFGYIAGTATFINNGGNVVISSDFANGLSSTLTACTPTSGSCGGGAIINNGGIIDIKGVLVSQGFGGEKSSITLNGGVLKAKSVNNNSDSTLIFAADKAGNIGKIEGNLINSGNVIIDLKGVRLDSSTPLTLVSGNATGLDKANILKTEFIIASINGNNLFASLNQNSITNFKNSLDSSQSTLFNSISKYNEFIYTQGDARQIKSQLDSTKEGLESSVLTPFSVFEMLEANFISTRLDSNLESTYLGLSGLSSKMSGANLNGSLNGFGIYGKLKFANLNIFSKFDYGHLNNKGSNLNNIGHVFAINSLLIYKLNFLEFGLGGNVSGVFLDSKRSFTLGNLNLNSNGTHHSFMAGINAEIGTRIYVDSMSFKPFVGAKFNFVNFGSLKESGDLGGIISGKNGVTLSGVVGIDGTYKINQMFSLNARSIYEIEAFNSFGEFLGGVYRESTTNLEYKNLHKFGVYLGGSLKFKTFNLSLNGFYKYALESMSFYGGEVALGYRF